MSLEMIVGCFNLLTAVVALASAAAALTPSKKHDAFTAKYLRPVLDVLALNIGNAKK
tara:strand:- start:1287 stop:1457 length:171 start_codon:yes stop_codon:yes gene_type:complete